MRSRGGRGVAAVLAVVGLAAVVALPAAGGARAAADGVTAASVVAVLQRAGADAEVAEDMLGDEIVEGRHDGIEFTVDFLECAAEGCGIYIFTAGFPGAADAAIATLNTWNRETIFGNAFAEADGTPVLFMSGVAAGGVGAANLRAVAARWLETMHEFADHVGWQPPAGSTESSADRAVASTPATLRVCNDSGDRVQLAQATAAGGTNAQGQTLYRSQGWFDLDDGACTVLWEAPFANRFYYVFAGADNGDYFGDFHFCTRDEPFEIVDAQCDADHEREGFFEIDMSVGDRASSGHTVNLSP